MLKSRITEIKKFVEFPRNDGFRTFIDVDVIPTVQGNTAGAMICTLDSKMPISLDLPVEEVMKIIEDARKIYIHDFKENNNE